MQSARSNGGTRRCRIVPNLDPVALTIEPDEDVQCDVDPRSAIRIDIGSVVAKMPRPFMRCVRLLVWICSLPQT
jgi:hypothetical protein